MADASALINLTPILVSKTGLECLSAIPCFAGCPATMLLAQHYDSMIFSQQLSPAFSFLDVRYRSLPFQMFPPQLRPAA